MTRVLCVYPDRYKQMNFAHANRVLELARFFVHASATLIGLRVYRNIRLLILIQLKAKLSNDK